MHRIEINPELVGDVTKYHYLKWRFIKYFNFSPIDEDSFFNQSKLEFYWQTKHELTEQQLSEIKTFVENPENWEPITGAQSLQLAIDPPMAMSFLKNLFRNDPTMDITYLGAGASQEIYFSRPLTETEKKEVTKAFTRLIRII